MKVKFRKLHKDAVIPSKAHKSDGGHDLTAACVKEITGDTVTYGLGFAVGLPEGYKFTIIPRSSFTKSHWVMQNSPGLVDENFSGEILVKMRYIGRDFNGIYDLPYEAGDRVAQGYLEEVIPMEFEEVDVLEETGRGEGGFGSSGK